MGHRNRRILAERLRWPDGVLEDCERIEDGRPDWAVTFHSSYVSAEAEPDCVTNQFRAERYGRPGTVVFCPTAAALDRELARRDTTGPLAGTDHQPGRPHWGCTSCGYPWPCPIARRDLAAKMNPGELATLMSTQLGEAAGDQPEMSAKVFFDRFIAWTRPAGNAI